jgi:hypothetical protein
MKYHQVAKKFESLLIEKGLKIVHSDYSSARHGQSFYFYYEYKGTTGKIRLSNHATGFNRFAQEKQCDDLQKIAMGRKTVEEAVDELMFFIEPASEETKKRFQEYCYINRVVSNFIYLNKDKFELPKIETIWEKNLARLLGQPVKMSVRELKFVWKNENFFTNEAFSIIKNLIGEEELKKYDRDI